MSHEFPEAAHEDISPFKGEAVPSSLPIEFEGGFDNVGLSEIDAALEANPDLLEQLVISEGE